MSKFKKTMLLLPIIGLSVLSVSCIEKNKNDSVTYTAPTGFDISSATNIGNATHITYTTSGNTITFTCGNGYSFLTGAYTLASGNQLMYTINAEANISGIVIDGFNNLITGVDGAVPAGTVNYGMYGNNFSNFTFAGCVKNSDVNNFTLE